MPTFTPGGNATSAGNPDYKPNQGQPAFYSGPWDCLGMSQSDFWSLVGAPRDPSAITDWKGVYNVDNNGVTRDQSCSLNPNGADGEGFLYVDGDLSLNSNFHYKGLIFVEGDFKINGDAWVLGGIVVKGKTEVFEIELGDILRKGKIESNYMLKPGDVLTVPERLF